MTKVKSYLQITNSNGQCDGSIPELRHELEYSLIGLPVEFVSIRATNHPGRARNVGIDRVTSKWTAFLDSDDTWVKDKIEKQVQIAKELKVRSVCSNANFVDKNASIINVTDYHSGFITLRKLIKHNLIINSSVLVDTLLLRAVGKIDSRYSMRGAEDYVTWLNIAEKSNWYLCGENLVNYRVDSTDSVRLESQLSEIDSRVQGLLGYLSTKNGNSLKSRIVASTITTLAKI